MKKRLKATTIDENFRTFLASKRSSGVREKTILSYQQAYQAINRHYPIGEMGMTAFHADTLPSSHTRGRKRSKRLTPMPS